MRWISTKCSSLEELIPYRANVLLVWLTAMTCFVMPLQSNAMPPMKKKSFENVYAGTYVDDDCPFTEEEARKVWSGELLRARLRLNFNDGEEGWLWTGVNCDERKGAPGMYIYVISGEWTWKVADEVWPVFVLESTFGIGDRSDILQSMDEVIRDTVTEYLKLNLE